MHCPQCGASYAQGPGVSFVAGCASLFAGLFVGCLAGLAILALVVAVVANSSLGNTTLSVVLVVIDVLAAALAVWIIWNARRAFATGSLFLVGLSLGLAGLLSTCSIILFNMGNFNFH